MFVCNVIFYCSDRNHVLREQQSDVFLAVLFMFIFCKLDYVVSVVSVTRFQNQARPVYHLVVPRPAIPLIALVRASFAARTLLALY